MIPGLASLGFMVVTPFILIILPMAVAIGMELPIFPSLPAIGIHHILAVAAGLLLLGVVLGCCLFFLALIIAYCIFRR